MEDLLGLLIGFLAATGALVSAFAAISALSATRRHRKSAQTWHDLGKATEIKHDQQICRSLHRSAVAKLVSLDAVPTRWLTILFLFSLLILVRLAYMAINLGHLWLGQSNLFQSLGEPWTGTLGSVVALLPLFMSSLFFAVPGAVYARMLLFRWRIETRYLFERPLTDFDEGEFGDDQAVLFMLSLDVALLATLTFAGELLLANGVMSPNFPVDPVGTALYVVAFTVLTSGSPYILAVVHQVIAAGGFFESRFWWKHPKDVPRPFKDTEE